MTYKQNLVTVKKVLDDLLSNTPLQHQVMGNIIILKKTIIKLTE
ncbi:hypothetical protein [Paraflavitalea speifideaquila]